VISRHLEQVFKRLFNLLAGLSVAISQNLIPNSLAYESEALVKATGFREYDARWLFGSELNLRGVEAVGLALGTLVQARGVRPHIIVGHDYRSYSSAIKYAMITGLMASGCDVVDIGLCTTPMAYFAQFHLDVPALAMVTASHNENGWTGIKMGIDRPFTLGPVDMQDLKALVLGEGGKARSGGGLRHATDVFSAYQKQLTQTPLSKLLRVAVVCGNGTAGAFAPHIMRSVGCEVVEVDCDLDYNFPNYNPNPEDLKMIKVMQDAVAHRGVDIAFGFDGDGDRCGVVDNLGRVIFSDKLGLMLARDMAQGVDRPKFVVDVKSTGLFKTDPVLAQLGAEVDYHKTGHSYMKRRTHEVGAIAGFEKSGHFFFRPPYGLGYDDGIASAIAVCRMVNRSASGRLSDLYDALPVSWSSPTMSPHCADELKYGVVDRLVAKLSQRMHTIAGKAIVDVNTINGIRFTLDNGSWGLIRASSNKPELVVVCESMQSETEMREIFAFVESLLAEEPDVGAFNQTLGH
jgi:phosphomannomutase / phosphoglucomutase